MLCWHDLSSAEIMVLEAVFWSPGLSRTELARQTGFSRSKANTLVSALIERGLLDETGSQASSGGRRPEMLFLSKGLGVLAAVDIGASSVDVALVAPDMADQMVHHRDFPRPAPPLLQRQLWRLHPDLGLPVRHGTAKVRSRFRENREPPGPSSRTARGSGRKRGLAFR